MGQRSQLIVIDKDFRGDFKVVGVWHNQWLYGCRFISALHDILINWKKAIPEVKKNDWQKTKLINDLIEYVNYKDYPNALRFWNTGNYDENKSVKSVMRRQDNNNGYMVVVFDGLKVSYDIISGLEDSPEEKSVSAKEYVNFFYTVDELSKNDGDGKGIFKKIKKIESFPKIDSFALKLNDWVKVEMLKDCPSFIGIDMNEYKEQKTGNVCLFPEKIAGILIKKEMARLFP
uniref:Gins51 C-terminal domain-containing protein n=1 Tax=viral metagenome TaxID=1070528 RepID=A0A6H1ZYI4_9ZZZZ